MVRCFFITSPEPSPKTPPYFYRPTTYALLRRWERLRVGASAGMASPPTHRPSTPINSNHSSTPITYHPPPIIHHPDGEVFGEMSGEMFSGHLTIQTPHEQRDSEIFGEVLSFLDYKSRNSQQPNSCSGKQPQVERQIRLNGAK